MPDNSKLELVVEVDVNKANASIKSVNTGLSSMEQAVTQAARGASQGIDGMTASMVKGATAGHLLADSIKEALNWAREWTLGAAEHAAHTDKMGLSMQSLAKAHGISSEAAAKAVESVKKVGFEMQDAIHTIDRLIVADIGLSKAQGLAKVAKDAAAIENISAPEALEKILQSIEFGNARALRSAGLRVDFARDLQIRELQLGRTLTDNEQVQIRYNAVMKAAANIQGASAAAAGSAEAKSKALAREVNELKEAVGEHFQEYLKSWVGHLRDLVGFLRENSDWLVKFGQGALVMVGIITTIAAATKTWALAQGALNLAMAVNPVTLMAAGMAGAGVVMYSEYRKMKEGQQQQFGGMRRQQIRGVAGEAGGLAKLRAEGLSEEDIREALTGSREAVGPFGDVPKLKLTPGPDPDALKLAAEIRRKQVENERFFTDRAVAAGGAGKTGFAKEAEEMTAEIAKRTSFVDDHGKMQQVGLTPAALNSIMEEATKKFDAYKEHVAQSNHKVTLEAEKEEQELHRKRLEWDGKLAEQRMKHNQEASEKDYEHLAQVYAFEEQRAGFTRDARLRALESGGGAQTIEQKIAIERRKADIEIEYLEKVHEIKNRLYDIDTARQLMEEELTMKRLDYRADEIAQRINELSQQRQDIRDQTNEANDDAVQAARENASNRATQLVRDHNRQVFDSLKQQAGGVFDALLQKSQSVWSAIANSFKTAILTAIKDVVTSRVAAMLMGMLYGTRVSFGGGGGLGGQPVFGGSGGGAGLLGTLGLAGMGGGGGYGGGGINVASIVGGPGGTSGFSGPVGGGGGAAGGGFGGILQGKNPFGNILQNFKNINWGGLTHGKVAQGGGDYGGEYGPADEVKLGRISGANGLLGTALVAGGAILAMRGLAGADRGTWKGVGEGALGGAMIGFKFGGPLGAAAGAAIGAGIGIGEKLAGVESPEREAARLIKTLYGINISYGSDTVRQVVANAKQKFGGSVSMAVRSAEVRQLLQLYADSTGQKSSIFADQVRPASLVESGGALYQSATYRNGTPYTYGSYLPTLGPSGGTLPTGSSMGAVTVMVSPGATQDLWRTGTALAIAGDPRGVAQASLNGAGQSSARLNSAMTYLSPSTVWA